MTILPIGDNGIPKLPLAKFLYLPIRDNGVPKLLRIKVGTAFHKQIIKLTTK